MATTSPVTVTTDSGVSCAASAIRSGSVITAWPIAERSRSTRNVTLLSSRRRCSQPATVIRRPAWPARSDNNTLCIVHTSIVALNVRTGGLPVVPPHFAPELRGLVGPVTGADRRGLMGTEPLFPAARECRSRGPKSAFAAAGGSLRFG